MKSMNKSMMVKGLFVLFVVLFSMSFISAAQCNDGIDNDGDGRIDALTEISLTDNSRKRIATNNPFSIVAQVNAFNDRNNVNAPDFDEAFLMSFGPNWNNADPHERTLDEICNMLGYREAVDSITRCESPFGSSCNYFSPYNNYLWFYGHDSNGDGQWFRKQSSWAKKYEESWVSTLECRGRVPACSDGFDNDGDGNADFPNDPGCASAEDNSEKPHDLHCTNPNDDKEKEDRQCADGLDNDNDGATDRQDPGCWDDVTDSTTYNPSRNNEGRAAHQCADGVDNDGDGVKDAADPGCWDDTTDSSTYNPLRRNEGRADPQARQCVDGIDNDGDLLTDRQDPGCWDDITDHTTYNPNRNNEGRADQQCSDGLDNDGDGAIDASDPGCFTDPSDPSTYDPRRRNEGAADPQARQCADGLDNDGDSLIDRVDPGCWDDITDHTTYNPNRNNEGRADQQCSDGVDNDGDGAIDAADPGCWTDPTDPTTYDARRRNEGLADPTGDECADGVDNDGDGVKDAQDPGCWTDTTDPTTYDPTLDDESRADPTGDSCTDGVDNDGDGVKDAQDPDCWADPSDPTTYDPTRDEDGDYKVMCNTNLDCGSDINFGGICSSNDLFNLIIRPTCQNAGTGISYCSASSIFDFVESCPMGCSSGQCNTGQCTTDSDCGGDYSSNNFCGTDGNVYKKFHDVSCDSGNMCTEDTSDVLVETCTSGCTAGVCDNGNGTDTTGPVITLIKPTDGSSQSGDVIFEYTATDESGVEKCTLRANDVIYQTDTSIHAGTNVFVQSFITTGIDYTANIVCYDTLGNVAVSDNVTFTYTDAPMCTTSSDCGEYKKEYICRGDDLYQKVTNPVCSSNTCQVDETEDKVRTCKNGCSNGKCRNGGGSDDDDDDDTIPPIINTGINTGFFDNLNGSGSGSVTLLATGSSTANVEEGFVINWWIIILFLLILGIILVLILIVIAMFD